jgi:hypothetical protein
MSARRSGTGALAVLLCLWLGCGSSQVARAPAELPARATAEPQPAQTQAPERPVGRGHTREVTPDELAAIQPLIDAAQRVRGLQFERAVPVLVQDPEAITEYVDSQIKQDELERSRTIYTALGLLSPRLDVRKLLLRLMGEQIVGYYDVEEHHLIVRDDVMRAFGSGGRATSVDLAEARVVLVHELVHALQDQHLGLSVNIARKRDSDADNAFRALIEGDATLAMIAFALEREGLPLAELTRDPARVRNLSDLVRGSPLAGSELGSAPPIVRVPLLSAYVDGLTFAAYLHGDGGWGRVDRAHAEPPTSTEQVLHPERFARRAAPERVRLPDAADALGKSYELLYEDTLGELEMGVYFGLASPELEAQRAVQGWRGDRLYAYRSAANRIAIVWLTTWNDTNEAARAERAATRAAAATPVAERAQQLVARSGRVVLMLRNVPAELHPALRERLERWQSGGSPSELGATR